MMQRYDNVREKEKKLRETKDSCDSLIFFTGVTVTAPLLLTFYLYKAIFGSAISFLTKTIVWKTFEI